MSNDHMLKILHIAPIADNHISGPRTVVPPLIEAQNRIEGIQSKLLVSSPAGYSHPHTYEVFQVRDASQAMDWLSKGSGSRLAVFHGAYAWRNLAIALQVKRRNIPYIVVPHGNLTGGAQTRSRWKKTLANRTVVGWYLRNAIGVQCLTDGERHTSVGIQRIGGFVLGNGTEIPDARNVARSPKHGLLFVFIGRLDVHHKGLDLLIEGINLAKTELREEGCLFHLYGPDHRSGSAELKRMIGHYEIADLVEVSGPVVGDEKERCLLNADVFLHTSRLEGHPAAVLEALAYGVPCLLTRGTNMADQVRERQCGWETPTTAEGVALGLREVLANRAALGLFSDNARRWAEEEFGWDVIASRSIASYLALMPDPMANAELE